MKTVYGQTQVSKLEEAIKSAKSKIKRQEALDRISRTHLWKVVINEGYLVGELNDSIGKVINPKLREDAEEAIHAIALFAKYLEDIGIKAEFARDSLRANELELQRYRMEGE